MSIATIQETIDRGNISIYLSANDNSKGGLFSPRLAAPGSAVSIALITDALTWGYEGGAQSDINVREMANYLIWLIGIYGQEAQYIIDNTSGGGTITPSGDTVFFPFYINSSNFESDGVTYLNSKIAGTNISLFINEYSQQFFPGTEFTYVAGGGFVITAPGFDANSNSYTIRVEKYYPIP